MCPCTLDWSIFTNFGKIERTYHLPFQGGSKTSCVDGKVPRTKKFTRVTNRMSVERRRDREKKWFFSCDKATQKSFCLSDCLSVCLSDCLLSVGPSVCPSDHWFVSPSVGSYVWWSIHPSVLNVGKGNRSELRAETLCWEFWDLERFKTRTCLF